MSKKFLNNPKQIEEKSFEIIQSRLYPDLPDEAVADIIYRIIHTTADFEMKDLIEFKNGSIEMGLNALANGSKIYADTKMIREGVNKQALERTGSEIINKVHDQSVVLEAKETGKTRSSIAVEKALEDPEIGIFAIGNAPTALFTLIEKIKETGNKPDLIIGVPVGFVGASESKEALNELDELGVPYIRINGEKGGSTIAVAILNALLYRLGREW